MSFALCLATNKAEQLGLLQHVLYVEHEARELLHVFIHNSSVLEMPHEQYRQKLLLQLPLDVLLTSHRRPRSINCKCPPPELCISDEVHGDPHHLVFFEQLQISAPCPRDVLYLLGAMSSTEGLGLRHSNPGWFDNAHMIGQSPLDEGKVLS
ncbi:hypothetical protein AMTRI_Chr05g69360 [Amborella trichopoda]